jgi:hypothetical protein
MMSIGYVHSVDPEFDQHDHYFDNTDHWNGGRAVSQMLYPDVTGCPSTGYHVHETHLIGEGNPWSQKNTTGIDSTGDYPNDDRFYWTREFGW